MRVMLINPPIDCVLEEGYHVSPVTQYLFPHPAPLGILYIAALLEKHGHEVAVIDAAAELLNVESTNDRVQEWNPDVIGIGSFTVTFDTTCRLTNKLKESMPEVPVVLGSYHVTLVPNEAMSHTCFDVGVIHEGEFTMLELVNYFADHAHDDISGFLILKELCTVDLMNLLRRATNFVSQKRDLSLKIWTSCLNLLVT